MFTLTATPRIAALAFVLPLFVTSLNAQIARPAGYEQPPVLSAQRILQPRFLGDAYFLVQDPVPTAGGLNRYTINSQFGVFTAEGNFMLTRRVAGINGIAQLRAMEHSREFINAAGHAVQAPVNFAGDLVEHPVDTVSSVPKGLWGFLNQTGKTISEAAQGVQPGSPGNVVEDVSGFAKTKRDIAIKLGVDPYSKNEMFQKELAKVAWPVFLGKFTVNLGLSAIPVAGLAFSVINVTDSLRESLRDLSPVGLQLMNLGKLRAMGVPDAFSNTYLHNKFISPTAQTVTVAALAQLGNIPGQADFIRRAAKSKSEVDALRWAISAELMAKLNKTEPVTRIMNFEKVPICQTNDGTIVVPIEWDYGAWTAGVAAFVTKLKAHKFNPPATASTFMITGVVSPLAAQGLVVHKMYYITRALPGPLR